MSASARRCSARAHEVQGAAVRLRRRADRKRICRQQADRRVSDRRSATRPRPNSRWPISWAIRGPISSRRSRRWIGRPLPDDFHTARAAEDERVMAEGIGEVAGAVDFVQSLPADLPKAVVSSSSTRWIRRHLDHIGLADAFGDHLYRGREHVDARQARARPLSLRRRSTRRRDRPNVRSSRIRSSARPVRWRRAAMSSGCARESHCAPDHADRLRAVGVDAVAAISPRSTKLLAM